MASFNCSITASISSRSCFVWWSAAFFLVISRFIRYGTDEAEPEPELTSDSDLDLLRSFAGWDTEDGADGAEGSEYEEEGDLKDFVE